MPVTIEIIANKYHWENLITDDFGILSISIFAVYKYLINQF